MNFEEITADEVKNELEKLIWEYPDRYGSISGVSYDDGGTCVYYTDKWGLPVSTTTCSETANLVTPVCIVGVWVERFHPELKDHPQFGWLLHRNMLMARVTDTETPLNMDAMRILVEAQTQQDQNIPWSKIKL